MTSQRISEELTIEHDQHKVFACVWHSGQLIARERIPRQYMDVKCAQEKTEEYLKGVCVRLMGRYKQHLFVENLKAEHRIAVQTQPTVKEDNGQVIDLEVAGSIEAPSN